MTAGYGTYRATGSPAHERLRDGGTHPRRVGHLDGYLPTVRTITVDMSKLSGSSVTARWYDPTNDTYSTVAGSPFANIGTRQFTPPGNNAEGSSDWVLVLEAA